MSTMNFMRNILSHLPSDWLKLTTHRLDIYNEGLAKVEFLQKLEALQSFEGQELFSELEKLPTAFDYIRLGHPLSCLLEWYIAKEKGISSECVVSFSSGAMSTLAVLRKNLFLQKSTQIIYTDELPDFFDEKSLREIYGYQFELKKVSNLDELEDFNGSRLLFTSLEKVKSANLNNSVDFIVGLEQGLGSIIVINTENNKEYISEVQHVRRRESIAMTPKNCLSLLKRIINENVSEECGANREELSSIINEVTNTKSKVALGSSGLSVQYAIMMGLVDYSKNTFPNKDIKFIVPPNCYGGTNDQARRVAACIDNVEIVDLPVDSGKDMVASLTHILDDVASKDGMAFIIAEIPTNPRVEVPDLIKLRETLAKERKTSDSKIASEAVFILDQTFCPNVKFLGAGDYLHEVPTLSYVSGSKFPSGGLCTAGYCVANEKASSLMEYVNKHIEICDNGATDFQVNTLIEQMPSMNKRIEDAYLNTRAFVDHIKLELPEAKINFVSHELASDGFTPSVFSLDLPTKGETYEQRESHKRELNLLLINMMIEAIADESKFCVSYGQLKGCYWTIPATSTQGTTKEGDKDYIVRVSLSPKFDLEKHKSVFTEFCKKYIKN